MQRSEKKILTTHAGSLPRGEPLGSMLIKDELGKKVSKKALTAEIERRIAHVLAKQAEAGVDIANDGEQGRVGFQTYIPQRMDGFAGVSQRRYGREFVEFGDFTQRMMQRIPKTSKVFNAPEAQSDLHYHGQKELAVETERLKRLAKGVKPAITELFMNAPSPGIIATTMLNAHYKTEDEYLDVIAREMAAEYKAVVDAGYLLQIDAPDMAMERVLLYQDDTDAQFAKTVGRFVATLNKALAGIPKDRVRLHVCWGNWEGPHCYDIAMEAILPELYKANVGALGLEFANPRRQHESAAIKKVGFPKDMVLVAGMIDSKSNFVEHPEVVAQRIEKVVEAVGDRERVIAGVDCGFGTFVGWEWVAESVVWAKLKTLRAGADLATKRLW